MRGARRPRPCGPAPSAPSRCSATTLMCQSTGWAHGHSLSPSSVPDMPAEIAVEQRDGVATITLDAADRRNALTHSMAQELVEACERIDADESVGAVVVQGAGGFFCAGGDRKTLADAGRDPASPEAFGGLGHRLPLVRPGGRAGAAHDRRRARRRGGRGREPGLRHRPADRLPRGEDHLRLPADRPPSRRRPRRAARPHRPARGGRRDGAVRRGHRRRARRRAGPGVAGGGRRRGGGHRRGAGRAAPRRTPSWPGAPPARCARSGARRRCRGRRRWSWSGPPRCGRCGARTWRRATAEPRGLRHGPAADAPGSGAARDPGAGAARRWPWCCTPRARRPRPTSCAIGARTSAGLAAIAVAARCSPVVNFVVPWPSARGRHRARVRDRRRARRWRCWGCCCASRPADAARRAIWPGPHLRERMLRARAAARHRCSSTTACSPSSTAGWCPASAVGRW